MTPKCFPAGVRVRLEGIDGLVKSEVRYPITKDNPVGGFPPQALGYLYFRPAEPQRLAAAAEIRFRLAASVETFAMGQDLKTPDGEPWHLPLFTMASNYNKPLYDKLVEEGLVTKDVDRSVMALLSSPEFRRILHGWRRGSNLLYTLSDPFTVDVSGMCFSVSALTESGFGQADWILPFVDRRNDGLGRPRMYRGIFPTVFFLYGLDFDCSQELSVFVSNHRIYLSTRGHAPWSFVFSLKFIRSNAWIPTMMDGFGNLKWENS